MTAKVIMLILCFIPSKGELSEAWRIEKEVTLEHCLLTNQALSGGGRVGVVLVKCTPKN